MKRPFALDVLTTAATSVATMVALVWVTRWMAGALSTAEFGVYGVSRRLAAAVSIYSNVTGLTLARYLGMRDDPLDRDSLLLAALLWSLGPAIVLLGAAVGFPGVAGELALGDAARGPVAISIAVLILGTAAFNIAFAYYRGVGRMLRGNHLQIIFVAVLPLAVAWAVASLGDVAFVNLLTGGGMVLALVPLLPRVVGAIRRAEVRQRVLGHVRETLGYGLPRIPGGFAFGGLMAIGPYMAGRAGALSQAGFLVAGQSLLRVVEAGTAAFGVVALPKVAGLLARGEREFLRARAEDLIALVIHVGVFAGIVLFAWGDAIVLTWLGPAYTDAVPVVRVLLVAAAPYLGYVILRSIVDALDDRAVNTANVAIALAVTAVGTLLALRSERMDLGLAWAATAGLLILGALSIRFVRRSLDATGNGPDIVRGAVIAIGAALPSVGARWSLDVAAAPGRSLLVGAGVTLISCAVFAWAVDRAGLRWARELRVRIGGVLRRG